MKKRKEIISIVLIVALIFTCSFGNIFANEDKKFTQDDIIVIENNDSIATIKGEYQGDVLYATLDKNTHQISMQSEEKPETELLGIEIGPKEIHNYSVQIVNFENNEFKAKVTDKDTKKDYMLESSDDYTAIAQAGAVIPLVEVIGSALLAWLLENLLTITIAGMTAVIAYYIADSIREKSYNYYYAFLSGDEVYIGDAFPYDAAAVTYLKGSQSHNVFAKTDAKAKEAAYKTSPIGGYWWHDNSTKGDGYYCHYHPTSRYSNGTIYKMGQHCWYF